jgi:hypothetical protein
MRVSRLLGVFLWDEWCPFLGAKVTGYGAMEALYGVSGGALWDYR